MKRLALAAFLVFSAGWVCGKDKQPTTYTIPNPPRPDFSALEWLGGEWSGKTTSREVPGNLRLSATFDLDRRFMVLRETVTLPASGSVPEMTESWLGILSGEPAGKTYSLRVYSSAGFMTRYRVTVEQGEIRFNPEGGEQPPPGWLFRRVLSHPTANEMTEVVQAAPPGKPFFEIYSARLTRLPPAGKAGAVAPPGDPKKD